MRHLQINLVLGLLVMATGCTHMMKFTPPDVQAIPFEGARKGTAVITRVEDRRPEKTCAFVFSNPPHKWVYHTDEKVEDVVRRLVKEGLQRRGLAEGANSVWQVNVEVLDFSGHNIKGFWYVGKCVYTIRCAIRFTGPDGVKALTVSGSGENRIARLSEENMDVLLSRAYDDFLKNLGQELARIGY